MASTHSEIELALFYGRPVWIFTDTLERVADFPEAAPRVRTIKEVEVLLRKHVFTRPATLAAIVSEYLPAQPRS